MFTDYGLNRRYEFSAHPITEPDTCDSTVYDMIGPARSTGHFIADQTSMCTALRTSEIVRRRLRTSSLDRRKHSEIRYHFVRRRKTEIKTLQRGRRIAEGWRRAGPSSQHTQQPEPVLARGGIARRNSFGFRSFADRIQETAPTVGNLSGRWQSQGLISRRATCMMLFGRSPSAGGRFWRGAGEVQIGPPTSDAAAARADGGRSPNVCFRD
jgi:hypothetical protein